MGRGSKVIELGDGCALIRLENGPPGGFTYLSDEIGGGVRVWDTCLVNASTLQAALRDWAGEEQKNVTKTRSGYYMIHSALWEQTLEKIKNLEGIIVELSQ